ncbi:MAG: serpin family protein [Planctomycetes bacterium]|nr:serpin family protein [Planctomycetota bacterium]
MEDCEMTKCRFPNRLLLFLCIGCLVPLANRTSAVEPPQRAKNSADEKSATHVIAAETAYYTTGPQQGRPPDGKFKAGTRTKLLREAGSYSLVRAENGVAAYVATNTLKKIGKETVVKITDDVRAVAKSNNQFAFDLYGRLHEQRGNLFFSPASISTALAMTYAGAEGQTEKQLAQVLHFRIPEEQLHAGFGTMTEVLNSDQPGYRLNMANRLWAQESYPFRPEFLAVTRKQYGSELAQVDFAQKAEQARQIINAWIEEQTNGKIEDLIPPSVLDAMTRLVLTNAIYFKGAWEEEFSKEATEDAPFHLSHDRQIETPTMRQKEDFRYAADDDLQILELPYAGRDLSMLVLLPKEIGRLGELERRLTAENFQKWTSGLRKREVQVYLPKFKLTSQFAMSNVLRGMGMELAFSDQADFTGMSTAEELMISEVVHKAFVDVNEEGTEAAAATGVVVAATAAPVQQEPVVFRADHPFVFLIRDNRTGAILFLGRVANPNE